jgi:hypothetical protein
LLYANDRGSCVRQAQELLQSKGYMRLTSKSQDAVGPITKSAVKRFQTDHGLEEDGIVGPITWRALTASASTVPVNIGDISHLPAKCQTKRKSICIIKGDGSRAKLYAVQNRQLFMQLDVRTGDGGSDTETTVGNFSVGRREPKWHSTIYDAPMPYSLFFNRGQAIHFSDNFAEVGYGPNNDYHSGGCVNINNIDDAKRLYDWAPKRASVFVI